MTQKNKKETTTNLEKLRAPFAAKRWRAGNKSRDGKKIQLLPYIDSRDVQERLDMAVGPGKWQDKYHVINSENGVYAVYCDLCIRIDDEWVCKSDCGAVASSKPSKDLKAYEIEKGIKGAASDAFKRAAVKWGIGRYLYAMQPVWIAFDPQRDVPVRDDGSPVMPWQIDAYAESVYSSIIDIEKGKIVAELKKYKLTKAEIGDVVSRIKAELGLDISSVPELFWEHKKEVEEFIKTYLSSRQ